MKNRPQHQVHQSKSYLIGLLLVGFLGLSLALLTPVLPAFADGDGAAGETGDQDSENPTPGDGENPEPEQPENPENPDLEQPDPEQPNPEQPDEPGNSGGDSGGSTTRPTRPGNAVGGGANRPTAPTPSDNQTNNSNNQVATTTKPTTSTTPAPSTTPSATEPEPSPDEQTVAKTDDSEIPHTTERTDGEHEETTIDAVTDSADLSTLIAVLALGSSLAVALPLAAVVGHKLLYSKA